MKERVRLDNNTSDRHRLGRWLAAMRSRFAWARKRPCFIAPRPETDLERLQRLGQWCLDGRRAAAELELHDWQRHDSAPLEARVLLASLLAQRGRVHEALGVIRGHAPQHSQADPAASQMLLALLTAAGQADSARDLADNLRQRAGDSPVLSQWVTWMDGGDLATATDEATAGELARELLAQPQVIMALVAAQRLRPRTDSTSLLRRALTVTLRSDVQRQVELIVAQALAELALLAADHADARIWAHHGLKLEPYRVALALLLSRIEDDARSGPPAQEILSVVAAQHPDYPDVQAALIRRFQAQGQGVDARNHLAWWQAHSPDNPHARQIAQELAA